jgi:hypothetical protein
MKKQKPNFEWNNTIQELAKLRKPVVSQQSEQLVDFLRWLRETDFNVDGHSIEDVVDEYQKSTNCA